jgi:hypothetical protein
MALIVRRPTYLGRRKEMELYIRLFREVHTKCRTNSDVDDCERFQLQGGAVHVQS